jgi:hypothetical protein
MLKHICPAARRSAPFLALACLIATPAAAQQAGFSALQGDWRGNGTLRHQNGVTERVRCEATYRAPAPERLRQSLRCRSDQSQFSFGINMALNGGEITGDWTETTRNASGSLRGRLSPGLIQGRADGPGFAANVGISFTNSQQNITIRTSGADLSAVNMVLSRAGR